MRRSVGLGAVQKKRDAEKKFTKKSQEIDKNAVGQLQHQLGELKDKLQLFAAKHAGALQTDPIFRKEFIQMCASIGVDPLQSSKSFWTECLGVGSYYWLLSVQVIEIVLAGKSRHGGVMKLRDLWQKLESDKPKYLKNEAEISFEDIYKSIEQLQVLGNGCGIIKLSDKHVDQNLVYCVPEEMSFDNQMVIQAVAKSGKANFVTADVAEALGWQALRAKTAIDKLIQEGFIWVEIGTKDGWTKMYWMAGLFFSEFKV